MAGGTGVDTTVPHSARIWNYWLGGKDNFPVDRMAGDQYAATFPDIVAIARAQRAFIGRVVSYLAAEEGIRQFIDVGTGLPTADNTHEVAQRVAPEARVVYVDNDPMVLAHARALLLGSNEGATAYLDADMRDPSRILIQASDTLDLGRPTALLFMGALGHVIDLDEARGIVATMVAALASGSFVALCDGTVQVAPEAGAQAAEDYNESGALPYVPRTVEQVEGLFGALPLVPPGFVPVTQWRPLPMRVGMPPQPLDLYGGVARKP
jgi:S-adenosyl methyltransferase